MSPSRPTRAAWRAGIGAALAAALALAAVGAIALGADMRADVSGVGERAEARAAALAASVDPADPASARPALARGEGSARLVGPGGRMKAGLGPESLWAAGGPGAAARLATLGAGGWSLRDGAVEARRTTARGASSVVVRIPLPPGMGTIGGARAWPVVGLGGVLALLAGALAAWRAARVEGRLRRLAAAADATAGGRPAPPPAEGRGAWAELSEAGARLARRCADLQAAAEARVEALGAALAPLAHPVAARTPAGGRVRNEALERLVGSLGPEDAGVVEDAVRTGLAASGPVARRVALSDGRKLDVEAWSVPGGRLVALSERTEQERLAALRRQITGAAARHLQAPVSEVQALGSELLGQVAAPATPSVRRILAAADRMERLVRQLLRGTENDPRGRPLRVRTLGAAGVAYGLGRSFDRWLRDRGLRLEHDIPADLPPLRADPALVHEILSELVSNSAMFTPRGGTITLAARPVSDRRVGLTVSDTGPGIPGEEVGAAAEPFTRGAGAAGLPGAGLGLGVASALAERLGGRLVLERGPGGRARLELPVAGAPDPEEASGREEPALSAAPAASP